MEKDYLLNDVLKTEEYLLSSAKIPVLIGIDPKSQKVVVEDLLELKHILISGGVTGKSELIYTIVRGISEKHPGCKYVIITQDISTILLPKRVPMDVALITYKIIKEGGFPSSLELDDEARSTIKYIENECIKRIESSGTKVIQPIIVIIDLAINEIMGDKDSRDILNSIFADLKPNELNIHFIISDQWLGDISNSIMCEIPCRISLHQFTIVGFYHTIGVDKYLLLKNKPRLKKDQFYYVKNFRSKPRILHKIINPPPKINE